MNVELLSYTMNPEELISKAAKLCYSSSDISDINKESSSLEITKFLNHLIDLGHESPLEHSSFSFGIEGVSRITEIQLVRHRLASYSIQSGRYVKRDNPGFVTPPNIKNNKLALEIYDDICLKSIKAYNDLFLVLMLEKIGYKQSVVLNMSDDEKIYKVDYYYASDYKSYCKFEKQCIEDARYAHLQSIETKLVSTMNVRSLLNFFNLRCCERAQWEIREMANKMLSLCKQKAPTIFKYAGPKCLTMKCPEGKLSCGKPKTLQ